MTSLIRGVQDFVVKYGEIQGQSETDGVGWGKVSLRDFSCVLVGLQGLIGGLLALVTESELGQVTMVIALPKLQLIPAQPQDPRGKLAGLHLVVEDLRFT